MIEALSTYKHQSRREPDWGRCAFRTYPVRDRHKNSDQKTGAELPSLFLASVEWRYLSYVDKVEMMLRRSLTSYEALRYVWIEFLIAITVKSKHFEFPIEQQGHSICKTG